MIIDCAHYQDGRRRDEGLVSLAEAAARCKQGGFVWLGLFEPGEGELALVRDTFGLHELAVEDAQSFHMRPKIETYDQGVDGYAPVVAGLERDIDQVEATVFAGASAPTERIYSLRREATDFYRAVHPLLTVVATIERAAVPELGPYLRDVQDHLLLVNEEVAAQRDLLG